MLKREFHRLGIDSKGTFLQFCMQFIKFGIVGFSNTFISLAIYYICVFIGLHYILSNSIAFVISVFNAYYWNSKFVFKKIETGDTNKFVIVKVFISYGLTFILTTVLLYFWVHILGISVLIAPIINLIITIPINFLLNKFWAFK
jgi:putative flippase GtrA